MWLKTLIYIRTYGTIGDMVGIVVKKILNYKCKLKEMEKALKTKT